MTGFRITRSGWYGVDGVVPDLMTFGKVMGGGFPAAAFGGRADLMAHLAPEGSVYQAGTLSGNPVATTAGLTTLRLATDEVYARLDETSATIQRLVATALDKEGVPHVIQPAGNLFSVFFVDSPDGVTEIRDFAGASAQVLPRFAAFFHAMLDAGVYLPPSAFEAWFVSSALDDDALAEIEAALPGAARGRCRSEELKGSVAVTETTVVHLLRHGEVHNPTGVLYGRMPDYPPLRARSARWPTESPSTWPAATSCTWSRSPLERAQETMEPIAKTLGLDADDRRAGDRGGEPVRGPEVRRRRRGAAAAGLVVVAPQPGQTVLGRAVRPARPPDARRHARRPRERAAGHEALIVSHQLPIWTVRSAIEGRRLAHDPRKRQCSLASLTSFTFHGDSIVSVGYAEPAKDLLPLKASKKFVAGA